MYKTKSMLLVFVWDVNVPFSLYSVNTAMGSLTNAKKLETRAASIVSWNTAIRAEHSILCFLVLRLQH